MWTIIPAENKIYFMIATIINAAAVLLGTALGLLLKRRIPDSFKTVVMTSSGAVTLVLGLQMAFETPSAIASLFALLAGGFAGYALRIEDRVEALGGRFGDYELILIKSIMDGFMAIVFAANYGRGVAASILTILVYQGFFTLLGGWIEPLLGETGISAMSAAGGFLLVFLALGLLGIRQIRTGNFIPALILAPLTQYLYSLLPL